jgi:hypothetical protein
MGTIPLDHDNGQTFYHFVGGKPALAVQAFPAAADALAVFTPAGVHDFAFLIAAKRTFHKTKSPFLQISIIITEHFFPVQPFFLPFARFSVRM